MMPFIFLENIMQQLLNIVGYFFCAITFLASLLGKATCLAIIDAFLN